MVEVVDQDGTNTVQLEPYLPSVWDGIASILVTNHSGFTHKVKKGNKMGTAMGVAVVKVAKLSEIVFKAVRSQNTTHSSVVTMGDEFVVNQVETTQSDSRVLGIEVVQ